MKKYEMPALLSLLAPGFGQMVKGHIGKALMIMFLFFANVANLKFKWILGGSELLLFISFCIHFIVTAFAVNDAYNANSDFKEGGLVK